jgi:predicted Zn finger-like uncharacterized protein
VKISCPSCSAKYSIADEKVQNRLAKIRCRKCGTSIVIDGNAQPPNVYAGEATDVAGSTTDAPPPAAAGTLFSVDFGEGDQRQLSVAQIVEAYNSGSITAETYLWAEGYADWTPLGRVEEIITALQRAASAVDSNAAAARSTAPAEDPFPQPAARAVAPKANTSDLFGASRPAMAERDLGMGQSSGGGFGSSPPPSGARNESSVLFSLSALTSGSTSSRPSVPAPSVTNNDDSGLIDLKALTEAAAAHAQTAQQPRYAAPVAAAPAPFAPSPLAAPLGMPGSRDLSVPPPKSNTGLFIIGGAIIVAVVAAAAVFAVLKKEDPAPPAPVAAAPVAPAPAPAAASTSLPAAEPAPAAAAPATEAKPKATASGTRKTTRPTSTKSTASSSSSDSSSSSSSAPAASTAPKPKKSKCNCKPSDLLCAMKCSN